MRRNRISNIMKMNGDCSTGTITESWSFAYDGDGTRTGQVYTNIGTGSTLTTMYFMGGAYETTVETSTVKKYYAIAGMTVAMNDGDGMKYLLTDHLGSVVAITDSTGSVLSQQRYLPFGGVRTDVGNISQTDFGYTGQRALNNGLMDYHARFYDAYLNRWTQPDSIIPNAANPQSWNRFAYVKDNPLIYTDPTGKRNCKEDDYNCSGNNGIQNGSGKNNNGGLVSVIPAGPACSALVCSSGSNGTNIFSSDSGSGGNKNHNSNNKGTIVTTLPISPICGSLSSCYQPYSTSNSPQEYSNGLQTLQYGFTFFKDLSDAAKFSSEGMRAFNLDPISDFMIGASFQALSDDGIPNLSLGQKIGRSLIVGGESIGTDVASIGVGLVGGVAGEAVDLEGGGIVGFAAGRLVSSVAIDQIVWVAVNKKIFAEARLGVYP